MDNKIEAEEFAKKVKEEFGEMSDIERFLNGLKCIVEIDIHVGDDDCKPIEENDHRWDGP